MTVMPSGRRSAIRPRNIEPSRSRSTSSESLGTNAATRAGDGSDCGRGATKGQLARLAALTAEAEAQAARGELVLASPLTRTRPTPSAGAWYERDEKAFPLPVVTPKTYRLGGARIQ